MPEVIFTYSWIYDKNICELADEERLDEEEIDNKRERLLREWNKVEKEIFDTLTEVSGLEWMEEEIKCYLISDHYSFSDPLTLALWNFSTEKLIITLIHELIHRLFVNQDSNRDRCEEAWGWTSEKFDESRHIRTHIVLYAILIRTVKEVLGPDSIEKKKIVPPSEDYKKAWEIVQTKDTENILQNFTSRIES